jgi:hypothetical protein
MYEGKEKEMITKDYNYKVNEIRYHIGSEYKYNENGYGYKSYSSARRAYWYWFENGKRKIKEKLREKRKIIKELMYIEAEIYCWNCK